LLRYIDGNILLIWDRLPAHRSQKTQQFIGDQNGRLEMQYLPPYAPELNPVEYIWAHCKHHELPNVCAKNLWDLGEGARRSLKGTWTSDGDKSRNWTGRAVMRGPKFLPQKHVCRYVCS
jgi:DDE superfamily endonuclease